MNSKKRSLGVLVMVGFFSCVACLWGGSFFVCFCFVLLGFSPEVKGSRSVKLLVRGYSGSLVKRAA